MKILLTYFKMFPFWSQCVDEEVFNISFKLSNSAHLTTYFVFFVVLHSKERITFSGHLS